jgi:ADP-heptose:LPS heptosyltransferase
MPAAHQTTPSNPAKRILIGRTDNIGDVVLSLPMIRLLKMRWPNCHITVMACAYTQSIIDACADVDAFIDWQTLKDLSLRQASDSLRQKAFDIAIAAHANNHLATKLFYKAKIPIRIGRGSRLSKRLYLNRRLKRARDLPHMHEAELTIGLLKPLDIECTLPTEKLHTLISLSPEAPSSKLQQLLADDRFQLILHPFSNGNGREWPLSYFLKLCQMLDEKRFHIMITGSAKDGEAVAQSALEKLPHITNVCGKTTLPELVSLLHAADGVVANSTGPLHVAAACGSRSLGLFPRGKGIGMERWRAIGRRAQSISTDQACPGNCNNENCACMRALSAAYVKSFIDKWYQEKCAGSTNTKPITIL